MADSIRILSERPIEQLWLHLSSLESVPLARKAVERRAQRIGGAAIDPAVLDRKGIGVAYALRSAREYMTEPSESATRRVLSAYYGMMSFLSAVLIADPTSKYDLDELEAATKAGHGLGSVDVDGEEFPVAQKVYVTSNGFIHRYLKHAGIDPADVNIPKRFDDPAKLGEEERKRLVPLDELLARVPELAAFYFDITGRPPLSASVFAARKTMNAIGEEMKASMLGGWAKKPPARRDVQWVGVHAPGLDVGDAATFTRLGMPVVDPEVEEDKPTESKHWIGAVKIPEGKEHWHEALRLYKSPMSSTAWFRPVLDKIDDPLVLHFFTLYLLSIIVRYRPKLWREVTEGALTQYLALLRSYLAVVERVVPELVLARVLDRRVTTVQPGSMFAPI